MAAPLGGTVTIDTTTGAVNAANITAVIPETLTFNSNVGAIPNYNNSGYSIIAADSPGGAYPIFLLAELGPSLVGYQGGSINNASNIEFAGGTPGNMFLNSAALTDI